MKRESYGKQEEELEDMAGQMHLAYNAHESYWYAYEHGASKKKWIG